MPPTVEVLVVSYASAPVVERLLASLARTLPDVPVAIREHGPDVGPIAGLTHSAPLRVSHDATNPGFGRGCNALAAEATAEWLLFLNPDTEMLTWPWHGSAPPAGNLLGPVMASAAHQHYGRSYRIRDEIALSWLRREPRRSDGTGYVSGAALLVERAAFERIGGFDERLFLFYEDIDLCLRANAAGIQTRVDARWTMLHGRHHSTADRFADSLIWSYESALYFYAKHGSPVWAYRAYKAVDAVGRAAAHALRRTGRTRAYLALARRAISG